MSFLIWKLGIGDWQRTKNNTNEIKPFCIQSVSQRKWYVQLINILHILLSLFVIQVFMRLKCVDDKQQTVFGVCFFFSILLILFWWWHTTHEFSPANYLPILLFNIYLLMFHLVKERWSDDIRSLYSLTVYMLQQMKSGKQKEFFRIFYFSFTNLKSIYFDFSYVDR